MIDLTDLEICKRIAEIEDVELFSTYNQVLDKKKLVGIYMDKGVKWHHAAESEECFFTRVYSMPLEFSKALYNPLTNAAIWSPFIEKYKLQIDMIDMIVICHNFEKDTCWIENIKDSLAKAICLAIIEAHKA